jgi:glycerol-3-phosphate acyltransferase PlsY
MDLVYSYSAFAIAYLIGSLSFAVIISKVMGLADPRSYGSKNPGATNVLRSGNKWAAVLTLLLDSLKGYAPVALVQWQSFELGFDDTTIAFVGLAAFLGHLFPVFFRFKGGKGVATALGVLLAFEPLLGGVTLLTWVVMAALFRYASLASVIAALFAPFYMLLFFDRPWVAMVVVLMSLMLIWRHGRNIGNLFNGKETKLGEKPADPKRRRSRRVRRLHDDGGASAAPPSHPSKGN